MFKEVDHGADGARLPEIVSIQPGEDLTFAELPASVDGVEWAAIRLGKPPNPIAIPLEEVKCPIRRAAVYDDALQKRVVLGKNTL
ncbi:MAG TPA: hypothetical protein VFP86_01840 [bacterium]|nr:hypothetical protein [bacterium]